MASVELDPRQTVAIDVEARTVTSRAGTVPAVIADGTRVQLLEGTWDATGMLLEGADEVARTAARLPYLRGFEA
jgi:3-isopropylmalate/(R)-2-methylmalate dehydratase small subunit